MQMIVARTGQDLRTIAQALINGRARMCIIMNKDKTKHITLLRKNITQQYFTVNVIHFVIGNSFNYILNTWK